MRALALVLALSAPPSAQTFASVHGGAVEFDLSGVGTAAVFDVRVGTFAARYLAVEGGLGIADVPEQFGDVFYALPSVEAQFGVPFRDSVRPFVALGVGAMVPLSDPVPGAREVGAPRFDVDYDPPTRTSVNVALGLDLGLTPDLAARVTGRLRATGTEFAAFSGTFTEATVGLGVRL